MRIVCQLRPLLYIKPKQSAEKVFYTLNVAHQ
jgi:hypothetical protein